MLEKKPNQCQKIIKYLKDFGTITSWQAYSDLGITQLGARIFELKKQGYEFSTTYKADTNRYGEPVQYKVYALKGCSDAETI